MWILVHNISAIDLPQPEECYSYKSNILQADLIDGNDIGKAPDTSNLWYYLLNIMLSSYFFIEQAVNQNKMGTFYYPVGKGGWSSFTSQTRKEDWIFQRANLSFPILLSIDIPNQTKPKHQMYRMGYVI